MKSTTLIEMNDPKLVVRGFDLGHKISSNLVQVFTLTELEHFENNLGEIPAGLVRFANRQEVVVGQSEKVVSPQSSCSRIEILRETPKPCANRTADEQILGMQAMYKMLGWQFNAARIIVPERRAGFDRLIVIGNTTLTNNRAFEACSASFPSWRYWDDLDSGVPKNERNPKNGIYAVWFRERVEADEKLKNQSANQIAEMVPTIKTITLLERQLFELVYYMETERHLDIRSWTLCSGSRDSDGAVPGARWYDGWFNVRCDLPDYRNPCLRAHEAVSL